MASFSAIISKADRTVQRGPVTLHHIALTKDDRSWIEVARAPAELCLDQSALADLWRQHPVNYGEVVILGKKIPTPRWQESFGQGYYFSGMDHPPTRPMPSKVAEIQGFVDQELGFGSFTQVLVNWYENGAHYIGRHSDDERQLKPGSPIVSLSYGATRLFRIRDKSSKEVVLDIPLPHNSIVVMGGCMQRTHTHEITKVAGKRGEGVGKRINVTLRQFAPERVKRPQADVSTDEAPPAKVSKPNE
eukprot:NODE_5460_length_944_cov_118.922046_g5241_i0.p1 GENE.NODE_5460_length_944_cov_118.922046_g5241_i0~~NODE_5460_length_944_cov_118.922046_g5241_i0.p1  ORF type:complete len:269 (-),score=44.96 NODE_5460_length_944_cov_118.922046_g5241_i0:137-874(-)